MSSLIKDISNQNEFLWRKTFNSQSKEKLKRIPTQENIKTFRQLKEQALKHPNLYVQADLANLKNIDFLQSRINKFFYVNGLDIAQILSILDFQTMEHIMRQRPVNVTKLIQIFNSISDKNLDLVKKIISCKNSDGSELTIKQKAESFNIVDAYIKNGISTDKIEKIIKSEDFNFIDLFKPLFEKLLKSSNMTRREIKNFDYTKIEGFDISKVHLILKTMQTDASGNTADLVKVMFNTDFKQYIHDSENIYGRKNLQTKEFFKENGLDYLTWINIDKDLEVRFQSEPQEFDLLKSISTALVESIEILRKNGLEKFIDKRFADCIKNGKFCLAPEIIKNKDRFVNFVKNLLVELNPIYERAKKNFETDKKNYKAINTLTVFYHIKECLKQLENIKISDDSTKMKEVDYTIKMWDRNPLKDILQGNNSDCCIQAGGVNGRAISQYLLYTTFNMLEIFDNKSDKIIGNILCYFVKNENNEPVLVLDNIEITPNHQLSGKADKEFRNAILEYAKKVAYAVSHNEDTKIYLGSNYNDVGCGDLEEFSQNVNIIGILAQDDEYYFDAMNGWVDVYRKDTCKLNYHDLSLN